MQQRRGDLDEEYKKLKEDIDLENWENIRGPRPYEDSEESVKLIQQRIEELKKKRGAMSMAEIIALKKKRYEEEERKKLDERRRQKEERDEAYRKRLQEQRALRQGTPAPESASSSTANDPKPNREPSEQRSQDKTALAS